MTHPHVQWTDKHLPWDQNEGEVVTRIMLVISKKQKRPDCLKMEQRLNKWWKYILSSYLKKGGRYVWKDIYDIS